jgi:hypothetical protein
MCTRRGPTFLRYDAGQWCPCGGRLRANVRSCYNSSTGCSCHLERCLRKPLLLPLSGCRFAPCTRAPAVSAGAIGPIVFDTAPLTHTRCPGRRNSCGGGRRLNLHCWDARGGSAGNWIEGSSRNRRLFRTGQRCESGQRNGSRLRHIDDLRER